MRRSDEGMEQVVGTMQLSHHASAALHRFRVYAQSVPISSCLLGGFTEVDRHTFPNPLT